jgi:hypothetical protein
MEAACSPQSNYRFIDCIESFINGAVPKLTLNRAHQMVAARYFAKSTLAGTL